MTIVVGLATDGRGTEALHLGAVLARSLGDELVLAAVVPIPWPPSPDRPDAEYRAYVEQAAEHRLIESLARLPADVRARHSVQQARSVPAGLIEVAEQSEARLIVLGSSTSGLFGRVTLGSVTGRLLHGSPIAVLMVPRGFRRAPEARITRVSAAYGGPDAPHGFLLRAAAIAVDLGVSLRVVTFAVRSTTVFAGSIETDVAGLVVQQWLKKNTEALRTEFAQVRRLPGIPVALETAVGQGYNWGQAIDDVAWDDGDLLAVGSSASGPIAQVFLGSHAAKILRHAPVPVVLNPRENGDRARPFAGAGHQ